MNKRTLGLLAASLLSPPLSAADYCLDSTVATYSDQDLTQVLFCSALEVVTLGPDLVVERGARAVFQPGGHLEVVPPLRVALGAVVQVNRARPLNDTGVTHCADGERNGLICPQPGYPRQDGDLGRDVDEPDGSDGHAGFRFTKLSANGQALPADASTWACVRDEVTGLVWEAKTLDGGIHDVTNKYRWGGRTAEGGGYGNYYYDDWNELVDGSDAEALCGLRGWRVPSILELENLADYASAEWPFDLVYFPNQPDTAWIWSASPAAGNANYAWALGRAGQASWVNGRGTALPVRLVHGPH